MELALQEQLLSLLRAWALGLGLGLGYDLLRPLRRRGGGPLGALTDLLFSLAAALACFLNAMSGGTGRFGLWELAASVLGFLLYLHLLSPMILPLFTACLDSIFGMIAWCKKISVNCQNSAKKIFQNVRK